MIQKTRIQKAAFSEICFWHNVGCKAATMVYFVYSTSARDDIFIVEDAALTDAAGESYKVEAYLCWKTMPVFSKLGHIRKY